MFASVAWGRRFSPTLQPTLADDVTDQDTIGELAD